MIASVCFLLVVLVLVYFWWRSEVARAEAVKRAEEAERDADELREERDGLVLLCDQERERAQIAETELYGLLVDHFDVTPIEAARTARRA